MWLAVSADACAERICLAMETSGVPALPQNKAGMSCGTDSSVFLLRRVAFVMAPATPLNSCLYRAE